MDIEAPVVGVRMKLAQKIPVPFPGNQKGKNEIGIMINSLKLHILFNPALTDLDNNP
jgi:hypothetical protein